jgi:NAD(P)-dependent dehydrogenase (short-subunit alcohol dehydrogenase family)
VACAGIATGEKTASRDKGTGAVTAHRLSAFAHTISINLIGSFACIARSAAGMLELEPLDAVGQRGVIITTASVTPDEGQIGQAAYAASKGGVKAMTLPIARDLMAEGVRINTILPGILGTPMLAGLPQNVQDSLAATVPFPKRLGRPDEYADTVLYLIRNDYVNGATLRLDGALRKAPRQPESRGRVVARALPAAGQRAGSITALITSPLCTASSALPASSIAKRWLMRLASGTLS